MTIETDSNGKQFWTILESSKDRLRDAGFPGQVVDKASKQIGTCLGTFGGTSARCKPVKCPDGSCGLRCSCKVGNNWREPVNDACRGPNI